MLRILTHNIYGERSEWAARAKVLARGLSTLRPQVMALQETIVQEGHDQTTGFLPDGYRVFHSLARDADGQGISIATTLPVREVHEFDLKVTPRCEGFSCTALAVEVDCGNLIGTVLFVNHFPQWQVDYEYERELQAVVVARRIEALLRQRPMHVVIAGDMDADPDAASIRFFTGKQSLDGMSVCYRNAWDSVHSQNPGDTFTSENPLVKETDDDWPYRRIDHILVRCGKHGGPTLRIASCQRAFDHPVDNIWPSDHYAVMCELAAS